MASPPHDHLHRILAPPAEPAADGERGLLRRLAATLAHNVNNALTGVIGYLELALRHAPESEAVRSHLEASLHCAHRAAEAVRRIVSFAGRACGPEALTPLPLADVAARAVARLRRTAEPDVRFEVSGDSSAWARASDTLLGTTLDLLLQNAVEALPDGGTVSLHITEGTGRARLSVRDNGTGMPPEALAHLFEPFHTTKSSGHLGLGLALCREMVQVQDGELEVATGPGRGTAVTLSFPAAEGPTVLRVDECQPATAPHWPAAHVTRLAM